MTDEIDWLSEFRSAEERDPAHSCSCSGDCDNERAAAYARIAELEAALRETDSALARERGGGSPLQRDEYIALFKRNRALAGDVGGV